MKVIGAGLNKTGTKTLRACLIHFGYRHITYDFNAFAYYQQGNHEAIRQLANQYDSCEDWPWPLLYRELDQWYPDAKFILTVRRSPEAWFRSLCKMSVRLGPMDDFDKHVYGYGMPHGHMEDYIRFYNDHNHAVQDYFKVRPHKLLTICWEDGDSWAKLANFLDHPTPDQPIPRENTTRRFVYSGNNLFLAHLYRIAFQSARRIKHIVRPQSDKNHLA